MINKYWVTPNNSIYRKWTDEEYKTCDPRIGIIEKMPYVKCKKCGTIINSYWDTTSMRCSRCKTFNFPPYKIVDLDTKLKCVEFGDKEINGLITQYVYVYEEE